MIFGQGMAGHNDYFREPLPFLGRMMVFIDSENLVVRYEAMIEKGADPLTLIDYEPKTFVWRADSIKPQDIVRIGSLHAMNKKQNRDP